MIRPTSTTVVPQIEGVVSASSPTTVSSIVLNPVTVGSAYCRSDPCRINIASDKQRLDCLQVPEGAVDYIRSQCRSNLCTSESVCVSVMFRRACQSIILDLTTEVLPMQKAPLLRKKMNQCADRYSM